MAKGDWAPLARRALDFRRGELGSLYGALVVCSSGTSKKRRERIERESREVILGGAINSLVAEHCAGLGHPDLGDKFRSPIRSDVPVLLVSGTADGRTTVANAEEVLRGFPNGVHLVVDGASHGYDLFYFVDQVREATIGFFAGREPAARRVTLTSFPFQLPRPENR